MRYSCCFCTSHFFHTRLREDEVMQPPDRHICQRLGCPDKLLTRRGRGRLRCQGRRSRDPTETRMEQGPTNEKGKKKNVYPSIYVRESIYEGRRETYIWATSTTSYRGPEWLHSFNTQSLKTLFVRRQIFAV